MNLRRKWLFIPILVVVALLVIGIIGITAYANNPPSSDNRTTFAARVADILGIDQAKVESAFTQANQEMRDEAMNSRLQKLIDEGKMTQEQADKYKTWMESRPNMPEGLGNQAPFGGPRGMKGCPEMGGRNFNFGPTPNSFGTN
jgi:hypothetical protein